MEALGQAAIDAGMKVLWFTLETLTTTIGRAELDAPIPRPSHGSPEPI